MGRLVYVTLISQCVRAWECHPYRLVCYIRVHLLVNLLWYSHKILINWFLRYGHVRLINQFMRASPKPHSIFTCSWYAQIKNLPTNFPFKLHIFDRNSAEKLNSTENLMNVPLLKVLQKNSSMHKMSRNILKKEDFFNDL